MRLYRKDDNHDNLSSVSSVWISGNSDRVSAVRMVALASSQDAGAEAGNMLSMPWTLDGTIGRMDNRGEGMGIGLHRIGVKWRFFLRVSSYLPSAPSHWGGASPSVIVR